MKDSYILITPAKNEEKNLRGLIKSVNEQKIKPVLWIIVDDGSQDNTPIILRKASSKYEYIQILTLKNQNSYDIGIHYAKVCRIGFEYAIKYCTENSINYEYIALSDADMVYPKDYFFKIIRFMESNTNYGIVGGKILIKNDYGKIYEEKLCDVSNYPRGTGRVWRKQAFKESNGYILTKSPDSVSNILAVLKGWKICKIDVICYQTRDTGAGINLWDGYFSRGDRTYYLGGNPLIVINTVIDLVIISRQKNALLKSLAFTCGYINALFRRKKKIEVKEVREYMGSYKRIFNSYKKFLNQLFAN